MLYIMVSGIKIGLYYDPEAKTVQEGRLLGPSTSSTFCTSAVIIAPCNVDFFRPSLG